MSSPLSAVSVVVADAGPLIALGRLDLIGILPRLFGEVQVPTAVREECMARPHLPDASRIAAAFASGQLIECRAPAYSAPGLDAGEAQAISRALEIGAALLVDERLARAHAERRGLLVVGTVGVLVRARQTALVPSLAPLLDALRAGGHYLSDGVVQLALRAAREAPPE